MDIPKPAVPDADTVQDGGNAVVDYLTSRGSAFWTLVTIGVVALVAVVALKNPLIRGLAIGAAILFVVLLSAGMFK